MSHFGPDSTSSYRNRAPALSTITVFIIAALFISISVVRFAAAGRDDAFIMFWSGKTFTLSNWFINHNGAHEEISSSVIGPWIASIGYIITPETPLLFFKTASLFTSLCTLCLIWWQRKKIFPKEFPDALVPTVMFSIAMSPMFQYWTLGGLETPFATLLLLWSPLAQVSFFLNRSLVNGALFALSLTMLSLVRTEGFIYIASALAFLLVVRDRNPIRAAIPIVTSLLITALMILVRVLFTGAVWPNPTYAKIGGLFSQLGEGYSYLSSYYLTGGPAAWLQGIGTGYAILVLAYYTFIRRQERALTAAESVLISISLYTLLHELFIAFCGGNWMEYYRFIVPTIPLKVLLVTSFLKLVTDRLTKLPHPTGRIALPTGLSLLCVAAAFQQTYSTPSNCATPMTDIRFGRPFHISIEAELITHNCAHGRDKIAILPFIRDELPRYVKRTNQVRVATYQSGYFPYHIRKQFSPDSVFFIDTTGVTTRDVARTRSEKSVSGVVVRIDEILSGSAGEISDVVLAMDPNMVYQLFASLEERENMKKIGYEVVWDRPNAVVFFRE